MKNCPECLVWEDKYLGSGHVWQGWLVHTALWSKWTDGTQQETELLTQAKLFWSLLPQGPSLTNINIYIYIYIFFFLSIGLLVSVGLIKTP